MLMISVIVDYRYDCYVYDALNDLLFLRFEMLSIVSDGSFFIPEWGCSQTSRAFGRSVRHG